MDKLRICVAGATGWAGSALSRGIAHAGDMELVAAISRSHAGKTLGEVIGMEQLRTPIFGNVEEALNVGTDIFVEYTKPDAAKLHIL
jgi:4-hydroxy-tetrahydrodipicolinate reductase